MKGMERTARGALVDRRALLRLAAGLGASLPLRLANPDVTPRAPSRG
jgi:hypothetical protein